MLKLYVSLHTFFHQPLLRLDERGVTSVEYGLLVALIALVIIGVVTTLGLNLKGIFGQAGQQLAPGGGGGGGAGG